MFFLIRYLLFVILAFAFLYGWGRAAGRYALRPVWVYSAFFVATGAIFLF